MASIGGFTQMKSNSTRWLHLRVRYKKPVTHALNHLDNRTSLDRCFPHLVVRGNPQTYDMRTFRRISWGKLFTCNCFEKNPERCKVFPTSSCIFVVEQLLFKSSACLFSWKTFENESLFGKHMASLWKPSMFPNATKLYQRRRHFHRKQHLSNTQWCIVVKGTTTDVMISVFAVNIIFQFR